MNEAAGQKATHGEKIAALEKSETLRGAQLDRLEGKIDRNLLWLIGFDVTMAGGLITIGSLVLRLLNKGS
jgi:hypothetical protein